MSPNDIDPDLNLQNFNDHGIFTIEEINELCAITVFDTTLTREV